MVLLEALHTARDLGRLHEIASVLIGHGLGDVVRRLGVARMLERAGRVVHWKRTEGLATKEPEVRVREALERLGPAFVKVGQILAGRSDLLPPEWTAELSRLHEHAAPVPIEGIRAQLLEDLGAPPEEVFAAFDPAPLAAASIAQVHRATLPDGTPVVLKIRRPGVKELVEADLRLLARLAERAEERMPELRRFRPRSLVRQFARSLRGELDLCAEARNAERLRANLGEGAALVVPRIHADWTTERLCVMDFLDGPSIGEWDRAGRPAGPAGIDPSQVARLGADAVLKMVFADGFFHADPHPGNVVLLADGRIGLLDFGMVGFLSESRRLEFLDLLLSIVSRREEDVVDTLLGWSEGDVDVDVLAQDCAAFIDRYHGVPLEALDTGALLADLTGLLRENDLFLPNDVALLLKVFVTLESLGRLLDPGFVMASRLEPFAEEAWREERSPLSIVRRGAREIGGVLSALPRDLRRLVRAARRGRLRIEVDLDQLERSVARLDRSANRVTMGLVTSALIVGTAVAMTVSSGPVLFGLPLFGVLGFASSILVGLWLLWSIVRSGRRG